MVTMVTFTAVLLALGLSCSRVDAFLSASFPQPLYRPASLQGFAAVNDVDADSSTLATNSLIPPLPLELSLQDGQVVALELTDDDGSISRVVDSVGQQFPDGPQALASLLTSYWQQHVQLHQEWMPRIYEGPSPDDLDAHTQSTIWRIELQSGLVLEMADSTIPQAGKGLFVRKHPEATDGILQTIGSAFSGYAQGRLVSSLSGLSEYQILRAFEFRLGEGVHSTVWWNGKLMTIEDAVAQTKVQEIVGHQLVFEGDDGDSVHARLVDVIPDDACNRIYFVPDHQDNAGVLLDTTIKTVGHYCNDLAGGAACSEEEYDELSIMRNILVLVPRVHVRDNNDGRKIMDVAGMPVLTLSRNIIIANDESPIEVGLKYGFQYWTQR